MQQQKERYPVDVMSDEEGLNRDDPDVKQKIRQARQIKKVWLEKQAEEDGEGE